MADVIKRLKYYKNQFLQEPDFTAEQEYHVDRQRRHNRQLHTPGIAEGLTVTLKTSSSVEVAPGTAIDDKGQQIVLHEPRIVGFEDDLKGKKVLVVISYYQEPSDVATVGDVGDRGPTRWKEVPKVEAIPNDNAPSAGERIRLAQLDLDASGAIVTQNMNVRTPAGARLRPEETLERLKLSRQGVPEGQWPVLSSGAANRADVMGDLNVTGNILVTGTVDGRDVSVDAAVNQAHRDNLNNPHAVTAAQVGAIVSIQGVSNAGGNIAVTGSNGITVTTNTGTKTVNLAGGSPTSIANVSNPGGNIAVNGAGGISVTTGVNAITINGSSPSTIHGVSSPGGSITFAGTGISIAADNGSAKKITFTTNPAAIGALPAGDYMRRVVTFGSFGQFEATKTINCGFLPKYIAVNWSAYANFNGRIHGVNSTAFVDVWGTWGWNARGTYQHIARLNGAPYWDTLSAGGYSTLFWLNFLDYTTNPDRLTEVQMTLDSVSNSGFVIRQNKLSYAMTVDLTFQLVVLG